MTDPGRRRPPRRTPAGQRERLPRRTPAQTRDLMLRAAVDLIRDLAKSSGDDVLAAALAHVKLAQVAERATALVRAETGDHTAKAITTGALYQQWPTQADFQVDLLFHIAELQSALAPGLPESILFFKQARADDRPLADMIADVMGQVHRHYREDPMYRVELSLFLGAEDPRLRAAIAHRQVRFSETADLAWQAMLDTYGLRLREPFSIRHLTSAVAAQIGGSVLLWYADPVVDEDPAGQGGPSLIARTIVAIVESMTEPADAG